MINLFKKTKKEEEEEGKVGEVGYTPEPTANYQQFQQPPQYDLYRYQEPFFSQGLGYQQQYYQLTPPPQQIQPIPQTQQPEQQRQNEWESYLQGIIEETVEDKLGNINNIISELKVWKEKVELEISKINEKINALDGRINNLYDMLAKKIEEYDKGIKEATVEVEALHRLIRTMIPAISESTKELKETIEDIKNLRDQLKRP